MPTLTISFDDLDDLLNRKTGNPLMEDRIVPLLEEVERSGGTVVVDVAGQQVKLTLRKSKKGTVAVAGRRGGGGAPFKRSR